MSLSAGMECQTLAYWNQDEDEELDKNKGEQERVFQKQRNRAHVDLQVMESNIGEALKGRI